MANRKRLVSIPGRSSIQGRRSTSHPRHSPKLGERPQYSARSLSRCPLRVFGTAFKNFKAEDRMKTIALIDTRSEVPGETLGILVSTHPDALAAFVANDAFQKGRERRSSYPDQNCHAERSTRSRTARPSNQPGRKQMNQSKFELDALGQRPRGAGLPRPGKTTSKMRFSFRYVFM